MCRKALSGDRTAEEAREAFERFAHTKGILLVLGSPDHTREYEGNGLAPLAGNQAQTAVLRSYA
ncbi:hypothetical protein MPLB_2420041 [Mesorhizobium sp. ORS 3324]|nr:hypothetical protein MPLB_2420041 [Mesorhizobium sp. ORS 3324]